MSDPIKILFVDDEPLILNALRRSLRREGYTLFFTDDPTSAVGIVGKEKIDIVVSDHMMPAMTGVEVLSLVARLHRGTTRIMMTGQADRQATIRAINDGCIHHFIEKPWGDAELKRALLDAARNILVNKRAAELAGEATSLRRDGNGAILLDFPMAQR